MISIVAKSDQLRFLLFTRIFKESYAFVSDLKEIEEFLAARGAIQTCNAREITTTSRSTKSGQNQRHSLIWINRRMENSDRITSFENSFPNNLRLRKCKIWIGKSNQIVIWEIKPYETNEFLFLFLLQFVTQSAGFRGWDIWIKILNVRLATY